MVEFNHDFIDYAAKLLIFGWTGIVGLVGGYAGARRIIGWIVRRYEVSEKQKQKQRNEISKLAKLESDRKYKRQDDALTEQKDQIEFLQQQNKDLIEVVQGFQKELKGMREWIREVQFVAGLNQDKIHQVETNTKMIATAADAIKSMNQFNKNEPSTEQ